MAHLTDMEELLASVNSAEVRDYMREAMNCYMAGAYRGCIVLSYIALFDDIFDKLKEVAKINSAAKTIFKAAKTKKDDQDVFETYLIDQLTSNKLLSGLDGSFLSTLRTLRNKSAHPSGHSPSAEEARFVFFEVVNRFLSEPILSTTYRVDAIISKLADKNMFPTTNISDIQMVVASEVSNLHPEATPVLIKKLDDSIQSGDSDIENNAGYFLTGLATLDRTEYNEEISKRIVNAHSGEADFELLILRLMSANANLLGLINQVSAKRFKKILSDRIDSVALSVPEFKFSHPVTVYRSMVAAYGDDDLVDRFRTELETLYQKYPYSKAVIESVSGRDRSRALLLDRIKRNAGSGTYDTANRFARSLDGIDGPLSEICENQDAFEIVVEVMKAAQWGAWGAQAVEDSKFSSAPEIRSSAIRYVNGNKADAKQHLSHVLQIEVSAASFIRDNLTDSDE